MFFPLWKSLASEEINAASLTMPESFCQRMGLEQIIGVSEAMSRPKSGTMTLLCNCNIYLKVYVNLQLRSAVRPLRMCYPHE